MGLEVGLIRLLLGCLFALILSSCGSKNNSLPVSGSPAGGEGSAIAKAEAKLSEAGCYFGVPPKKDADDPLEPTPPLALMCSEKALPADGIINHTLMSELIAQRESQLAAVREYYLAVVQADASTLSSDYEQRVELAQDAQSKMEHELDSMKAALSNMEKAFAKSVREAPRTLSLRTKLEESVEDGEKLLSDLNIEFVPGEEGAPETLKVPEIEGEESTKKMESTVQKVLARYENLLRALERSPDLYLIPLIQKELGEDPKAWDLQEYIRLRTRLMSREVGDGAWREEMTERFVKYSTRVHEMKRFLFISANKEQFAKRDAAIATLKQSGLVIMEVAGMEVEGLEATVPQLAIWNVDAFAQATSFDSAAVVQALKEALEVEKGIKKWKRRQYDVDAITTLKATQSFLEKTIAVWDVQKSKEELLEVLRDLSVTELEVRRSRSEAALVEMGMTEFRGLTVLDDSVWNERAATAKENFHVVFGLLQTHAVSLSLLIHVEKAGTDEASADRVRELSDAVGRLRTSSQLREVLVGSEYFESDEKWDEFFSELDSAVDNIFKGHSGQAEVVEEKAEEKTE
jgi:hypothetical protein